MAKGIRSKKMRKNRAQIRKTVALPIIRKRQEKLAEALKKDLEKKAGKTITGLKGIFSKSNEKKTSKTVSNGEDVEGSEEEDSDEEEEEEVEVQNVKNKMLVIGKPTMKVKKGSKPKINPNKPLVWFK